LTLSVVPADAIPATRRGGSVSRLPQEDQDALRAAASTGDLLSDGKTYPTARAARTASGPYRRFMRRLIANGDASGKVATRTWADGKKFRWVVGIRAS
jgi:hypothetical protein